MSAFSRLPIQQILVACIIGVLTGMYIFAPGIVEFSNQIKKKNDEQLIEGLEARVQNVEGELEKKTIDTCK